MGGDALRRAGCTLGLAPAVLARATVLPPRAALFCFAPEWMRTAGVALAVRGTRVLMYGGAESLTDLFAPPEARERIAIAVTMRDEEETWRRRGFDARYVGHPAAEIKGMSRTDAREALGLTRAAAAVALLPGSRIGELRANLPYMLDAFEEVRDRYGAVDARVLLAANLDPRTRAHAEALAQNSGVRTFVVDPESGVGPLLPAFDAAMSGPGTASLEAALADVPPVVLVPSRMRLLSVLGQSIEWQSLPNRVLGAGFYAEIERGESAAGSLAEHVLTALDEPAEFKLASARVKRAVGEQQPRERVGQWLRSWL